MLNKLGITVGNDTKAANAFMKVFPNFLKSISKTIRIHKRILGEI